MTTETQTNESEVTTQSPVSIADQDLSFSEYEKLRRGESVVREQPKSAPEQKKAQEQKDHVESDTAKAEDEVVDQENDDDHDEGEERAKPKKKGGFQRRIDKLNARAAESERRSQALEQELAQLKGAGAGKVPTETKSQEGKPSPDNFETHAEYVDALTDWKIEQKEIARKQEAEKSKLEIEHKAKLKTHYDRVNAFAEKVKDFKEKLEEVDDVMLPSAFQEVIFSSDNGPELLYELAKNRSELERIAKLPPLACARELGRLESKLPGLSSEEKKQEQKKITKAPKPIDPVGKNAKGVVAKSIDDPDLTFSEYEKLRREQLKRRA